MDWGSIVGTVLAAGTGGATGLLASILGVWVKKRQATEDRANKALDYEHEITLYELQMQDKSLEAQVNLDTTNAQGSWNGLNTSIQASMGIGVTSQWVTDVKSLFRPTLTLILWIIAFILFHTISTIDFTNNQVFSSTEMVELYRYMIYSVFYAASTATLWWFGDRAFAPPGQKHK